MPTKASALRGLGQLAGGALSGRGGAAPRGPNLVQNPRTGALGKWVPIGAKLQRRRRPRARGRAPDPLTKMMPMLLMIKLLEK